MRTDIIGTYRDPNQNPWDSIIIEPSDGSMWRTLYATSDKQPDIPVFTKAYRIDLGHGLVGMAYFDGKCLSGPYSHFTEAKDTQGVPAIAGWFQATLRHDGSFAVKLERWDHQNLRPRLGRVPVLEPATQHSYTFWKKLS
jgi:hypothetical protein